MGNKRRTAVLLAVVMAFVVVACGGGAGDTTVAGGASDTTAAGGASDTTAAGGASDTTSAGAAKETIAGGASDTTAGGSAFEMRVEVPQTDEMQDTAQYVTEPPWVIGYSDASIRLGPRLCQQLHRVGRIGVFRDLGGGRTRCQ